MGSTGGTSAAGAGANAKALDATAASVLPAVEDARVVRPPARTSYRPGEAVSFEGLHVEYAGQNVTGKLAFDYEEGTIWRATTGSRKVRAVFVDQFGKAHRASFTLTEKKLPTSRTIAAAIAAAILVVAILVRTLSF